MWEKSTVGRNCRTDRFIAWHERVKVSEKTCCLQVCSTVQLVAYTKMG